MQLHLSLTCVLVGLLATLIMDAANLAGVRLGVAPPPPRPNGPDCLGRWIAGMTHGTFSHTDILATPSVRGEIALGLGIHYIIGVVLALIYFAILQVARLGPTFLSGVAYGVLTTVFPWFLMFPTFGVGWFGKRLPHLARTALWNHVFYGLGLVLWTAVLNPL